VTFSKGISLGLREVPFSTANRYVFVMGVEDMNGCFFEIFGFARRGGEVGPWPGIFLRIFP